jgi:hypothetical protein
MQQLNMEKIFPDIIYFSRIMYGLKDWPRKGGSRMLAGLQPTPTSDTYAYFCISPSYASVDLTPLQNTLLTKHSLFPAQM